MKSVQHFYQISENTSPIPNENIFCHRCENFTKFKDFLSSLLNHKRKLLFDIGEKCSTISRFLEHTSPMCILNHFLTSLRKIESYAISCSGRCPVFLTALILGDIFVQILNKNNRAISSLIHFPFFLTALIFDYIFVRIL